MKVHVLTMAVHSDDDACPDTPNSHGYTCGWCDWGRDTHRNMTEYHDHVGETGHYGESVTYGLVIDEELLASAIRANWYEIRPHGGDWISPRDAAQAIIRECNILRRSR